MLSTTQEANEYREKFHKYYKENIEKDLKSFELERQSKFKTYTLLRRVMWFFITLGLLVEMYAYYHYVFTAGFWENGGSNLFQFGWLLAGVPFCITLTFSQQIKTNFELLIKQKMITAILSFWGSFRWTPKKSIDSELIIKSNLIENNFTALISDDYFDGYFDKHHFIISELKIIRPAGLDGKSTDILFGGVFIKLPMNKKINSQVIVVESMAPDKFITKSYNHLPQKFKNLNKIELEDVEFNRLFDTYSSDEVEARYILTTAFIERFKALKQIFNAKEIRASFFEDTLMIALSCDKDMFVLGDIRKPVTDANQMQTLFEEFLAIMSIVEILNLDSKTGL